MPLFDVLTIGSATKDLFLKSKHFDEVRDTLAPDGVDACFAMGAKIILDDFFSASGGGATNAAVTFARFGLRTVCATRVGNDEAGHGISIQLRREGISTLALQVDRKAKTAFSAIILSGTGHRAILTHRGAAKNLDLTNIPWKHLKAKWIYLTSLGGNLSGARTVFAHAKKMKAKITWNPGNAELTLGLKRLKPLLRQTAVLILNREEAALLTELPPRALKQILSALSPLPMHALVVTDGGKGAYVHVKKTTWFAPPLKAKRINTTGAGDALGSGFVGALAKGMNPEDALRTGMLNATSVICHMGAKAGILTKMPGKAAMSRVKIEKI